MIKEEALNSVLETTSNSEKIEKEIFSPFKVIPNNEANFIRKAKTIICYEVHLPFQLDFVDGYTFKIISREQVFIYSEKPRHNEMKSVMKCYHFFNKKYELITSEDKGLVMENCINTLNDIIKIMKSMSKNPAIFLLNNVNRDYFDMIFTYSIDLKMATHGAAVLNTDSIYYPTQDQSKSISSNKDSNNYLVSKLEDFRLDRIIDAFYYLSLAKDKELEKDFNTATINLQTGIEIFMYALFNKLVDEKVCHKPKGRIPYKNLLTDHLKPALETTDYTFDINDTTSTLYFYWKNLYSLRNDIVHDGYVLNYNEYSEKVLPSCDNLIKDLGFILNKKYPELNIKINCISSNT